MAVHLTPNLSESILGHRPATQTQRYKILVDTQRPIIQSVEKTKDSLIIHATDEGAGIMVYYASFDGKTIRSKDGTFQIPGEWDVDKVKLTVKDWASNRTQDVVENIAEYSQDMGSIHVRYTYFNRIRPRPVDLVARNTVTGREYFNMDCLPYGEYEVFNRNLPYGFQLSPASQTVIIDHDHPKVELEFDVTDQDETLGMVVLKFKRPLEYKAPIKAYLISLEDGKKTRIRQGKKDKELDMEIYSVKAKFGKYRLIFEDVPDDYRVYPNDLIIDLTREEDLADITIAAKRVTQTGKLNIEVKNETQASQEEIDRMQWDIRNIDQGYEVTNPDDVSVGTFEIRPKNLPQGTYLVPYMQRVQFTEMDVTKNVQFTLRSKEGTHGKIIIENKNLPQDLEGPTFIATDENGKIFRDLNDLPYGAYKLSIETFPKGHAPKEMVGLTSSFKIPLYRMVEIGEGKTEAKEIYVWKNLRAMDQKSKLYIRAIYNKSQMAENFNFKITGSDGKSQYYKYSEKGFFTNFILLPYDTYTIEPVNVREGITFQPPVQQIALSVEEYWAKFYYDKNENYVPYPKPGEKGECEIYVEAPVDPNYPYTPTLALYNEKEELISKVNFNMTLLKMEAQMIRLPEGRYTLRIEDYGKGYMPIFNNFDIELKEGGPQQYWSTTNVAIYPLYAQKVTSENAPAGTKFHADIKKGVYEIPLGTIEGSEGIFEEVPLGFEYVITPEVPEGYTVYPKEFRIRHLTSENVYIREPKPHFQFYPLEQGIYTGKLEESLRLAEKAIYLRENTANHGLETEDETQQREKLLQEKERLEKEILQLKQEIEDEKMVEKSEDIKKIQNEKEISASEDASSEEKEEENLESKEGLKMEEVEENDTTSTLLEEKEKALKEIDEKLHA
ncbi:MAG: hypothetical protein Q4Q17_04580, partial [Tissierellia bacterium]|nr:hypothetical protein [Tissierellia bacterium]